MGISWEKGPAEGAPFHQLVMSIRWLGAFPPLGLFEEFILLLGRRHFGNRVSGAKWGVARMPHAVSGQTEQNRNPQN